jgi:LysR family transcriptional regulator, low CO2-responsive transcriptional regulator
LLQYSQSTKEAINMIDIYEMQIFLAAAENGSFSEAGRRLQLSQPAVSMQIRTLEKRLGIELFSRAGRHISLTEAGHALIPMARDLVGRAIRVEEAIASLQGEVIGQLKLACSTTAGKYIIPRLIGRFIEIYPSVQVTCHVCTRESANNMLLDDEVHIMITSLRDSSRELEYRQFITDPVVLIVPPDHPWAKRRAIAVDELYEGRFILREFSSGTQQTVIQTLSEHNVSLSDLVVVMTLGNSEAIHLAVAEGIGAAFVSRRAAADGIADGRVVEVPIENLVMVQQLYMARHAQRAATSAQAAFWDFVYSPENRDLLANHSVRV